MVIPSSQPYVVRIALRRKVTIRCKVAARAKGDPMGARTRRAPLSRDRLLAAAVAIADADGLQAVTMRRLAADLGVEAMSLYHHLPGKDGLLDGLVETVVAEIQSGLDRLDRAAADDDWRARLPRRCPTARAGM